MVNNLNYTALGKRIREERMRQGISIEALAHRADISYVHMSHIETDDTKVSLPALVSIANALNVTTDFILYDSLDAKEGAYLTVLDRLLQDATPEQVELIIELAKAVLRREAQNTN